MFRRLLSLLAGTSENKDSPPKEGEIPPHFPQVSGEYQMTEAWWVTLPNEFAKRYEEGDFGTDLVLWRKGLTCWTTVYGMKAGETPASTLAWLKKGPSERIVQTFEHTDSTTLRYAYLIRESAEEGQPPRWALYSFVVGKSGHILMAIYFDQESDLKVARKIWLSITEKQ